MKRSEGMLGGLFSKSSSNNLKFLVSTFWESIENHNNYMLNMSPVYSNKATVSNDMTKMKERVIILADSWKIIKYCTDIINEAILLKHINLKLSARGKYMCFLLITTRCFICSSGHNSTGLILENGNIPLSITFVYLYV